MNSRHLITICSIFLLSFATVSQAHVPHDIIYSLDVSPQFHEDGLVFSSSTQFGAAHLVSSNYGETFSESQSGMQRTLVTGHTFSPNFDSDGVIYMATTDGYYKSSDRGKNWEKQSLFSNEEVLSICFSGKSDSIYVLTKNALNEVSVTQNSKLIKKFDKTTFGKLLLSGNRLYVHRVFYETPKKKKGMELVDYSSGTVDVLQVETGKWSPLSSELDAEVIADVDVSKDGSSFLVALKNGQVQLSKDAGKSWQQVFQREDDFICKLKFSPSYAEDGTIVCGTAKGFIFLSEDMGKSWDVRSNGLSRWVHHVNILINRLVFSPNYKNDKTIFIGKTTGFYKTTDNGKFWRHINVWNPKWGYFVYPAPGQNAKDVFTATYNSGISRSHDLGATWSSANIGITSAFANGMELSPNYTEDKTIFVLDIATGLYRSSNAGQSWSKMKEVDTAKVVGKPVLYRKLGVSPDFKNDGLMFLFSVPRKVLGVSDKHVWKFNDHTKELKQVIVGPSRNYINGFAFSPKGVEPKLFFAATAKGAFVSKDEGDTWQNMTNGRGVQKLFVSPNFANDGLIYSMDNKSKFHVSTDRGETFRSTTLNLNGHYIDNLTFSPNYANDKTLYVTTYGEGLFRSQDAGESWKYFGLRGKLMFSGPSFSANFANDKTLFAPAIDGIYRSTDGGSRWSNVLRRTQFLPKVPFLTLKDPEGREIPLVFGGPEEMKRYGAYDEEVGEEMFRKTRGAFQKIHHPKAYLASYYKFKVEKGSAVEVYFYGTSIELKCVKGNDLGVVDILLDGKIVKRLDLYNEKSQFDVTGFIQNDLPIGFHKLRIVATGEKNPDSKGTAFTFNAANIEN